MAASATLRAPGASARPSGLFFSLFARLNGWSQRRATRQALSRLTAHELDDIGLTRADLDRL